MASLESETPTPTPTSTPRSPISKSKSPKVGKEKEGEEEEEEEESSRRIEEEHEDLVSDDEQYVSEVHLEHKRKRGVKEKGQSLCHTSFAFSLVLKQKLDREGDPIVDGDGDLVLPRKKKLRTVEGLVLLSHAVSTSLSMVGLQGSLFSLPS